jgi:methylation protein EvaC
MNRRQEDYKCRVSGKKLAPVIDLGRQPLGNGFLTENEFSQEYFFPMAAGFCEESKMFQLLEQPEPKKMFHDNYAFFSSTSKHMQTHFQKFAQDILKSPVLNNEKSFVVELGCNDGILLRQFSKKRIRHLGIEPSLNVAQIAASHGVNTISEFFGEELAGRILKKEGPADCFLSANVMCHIPDILGVARGIKRLLKPKGLLIFEDPYLGAMIRKTSYDQIYDEHVFLFSAHSVQTLFRKVGMDLISLEPQKTHGGSMRYTLAHEGVFPPDDRVQKVLDEEKNIGLDRLDGFRTFGNKVEKSKTDLLLLLSELKKKGKKVAGYAATSKSTTILNYCQIGPDLIRCIYDTTPIKHGKFSPGMHIPIRPYEEFVRQPPDYAFLFAWNHSEEIMAKEQGYMTHGGKWITHVPEVRVIG